jgi:phosphoglycolate phosphatase-like HAD superfamily hydrolase
LKIYVDFDDCLCETGRYFSVLAEKLFGKRVPYEDMRFFELQKTFSLTEEQFDHLMTEGHRPEALLSIEETPGASAGLQAWMNRGYEVFVITGRPYGAYEPSRLWLDRHGLDQMGDSLQIESEHREHHLDEPVGTAHRANDKLRQQGFVRP